MKKILIVDDDKISLLILHFFLKKEMRYKIKTESDSKEALHRVNNFDIIVTDVCMPNVTGFDILKEAKKKNNKVFVFGTSASFSSKDEKIQVFDAFLQKPIEKKFFLEIIKKAAI